MAGVSKVISLMEFVTSQRFTIKSDTRLRSGTHFNGHSVPSHFDTNVANNRADYLPKWECYLDSLIAKQLAINLVEVHNYSIHSNGKLVKKKRMAGIRILLFLAIDPHSTNTTAHLDSGKGVPFALLTPLCPC